MFLIRLSELHYILIAQWERKTMRRIAEQVSPCFGIFSNAVVMRVALLNIVEFFRRKTHYAFAETSMLNNLFKFCRAFFSYIFRGELKNEIKTWLILFIYNCELLHAIIYYIFFSKNKKKLKSSTEDFFLSIPWVFFKYLWT